MEICLCQNLVPNGSFESFTQCPDGPAQINYTGNWSFAGSSTDYYNSCDFTDVASVPINTRGFQFASHGNAYIGMITFALDEVLDTGNYYYREPAGAFLTAPLNIGQKYFVSFKVVLTLNDFEACCANNKIGALFSTVQYSNLNPAPINNFAHVYSNQTIIDSTNWTSITGSFIADSAYTYISIGNFFDTLNINVVDYHQDYPTSTAAYYYIDDVKVSTDSAYVIGLNTESSESRIAIFPNPTDEYIYINSEENKTVNLLIYNIYGQIVHQSMTTLPNGLHLGFLESGVYFISFKSENFYFSEKLIINN